MKKSRPGSTSIGRTLLHGAPLATSEHRSIERQIMWQLTTNDLQGVSRAVCTPLFTSQLSLPGTTRQV